jgi:hypothetical protein
MSRDIEEFLRLAAEKRKAAQKQKPGGGQPQIVQAEAVTPARKPQSPQTPRKQQPSKPRAASPAQPARPVAPRVDTRPIQDHAAQLGEAIVLGDVEYDARIQNKFEHQVGTFSNSTSAANAAADSIAPTESIAPQTKKRTSQMASPYARMFMTPGSIRQAIVLNEILRRPTDRW